MTEPFSALFITGLAFLTSFAQSEPGKKFIESIIGKLGEKVLEGGLEKIHQLRQLIVQKLSGNPKATRALEEASTGDQTALRSVAAHLELEMNEDEAFAAQVKQIAQEIVNIGTISGQNVQNVFGGQAQQITGEKANVYQIGDNANITIGHNPN
jgi:hypothetical protein